MNGTALLKQRQYTYQVAHGNWCSEIKKVEKRKKGALLQMLTSKKYRVSLKEWLVVSPLLK